MAMTLFEASKRVEGDVKRAAIIEMFARNSDLLRAMPFVAVPGDSLTYNLEAKLPSVGFRGINEGYSESVGVVNPETERFRAMGGDLDVDKFLIKTRGGDIRAQEEGSKIKALSGFMTDRIINGDSTIEVREFDGLRKRVVGPQLFPANQAFPAANGALSLETLDAAIDQVDGPTALAMSKAMRRKLRKAARSNLGGDIRVAIDDFGYSVDHYNDLPILIVDYNQLGARIIDFNEAGPAGGTVCTSMYVVNIADGYVTGLQHGEIEVSDIGELQTKPVLRTRVEWIVGLAVMHGRALARIWGITAADVVA